MEIPIEVLVLEIKTKVLNIYPNAYIMEHCDALVGSEFCILKEPYKGIWRGFFVISGWFIDADSAWIDAWDVIKHRMLEKFEE